MTRVLVDCTASFWKPHNKTGVQRVVREICRRCSSCAPPGVDCLPVQWSMGAWRAAPISGPGPAHAALRAAAKKCQRTKISARAAFKSGNLAAAPVMPAAWVAYALCRLIVSVASALVALRCQKVGLRHGDRLFLPEPPYRNLGAIKAAQRRGARIIVLIHDLHAITHPHVLEGGGALRDWLGWAGGHADAILCVSRHTEDAVRRIFPSNDRKTGHFHLGSDAVAPVSSRGAKAFPSPFFLMVGTLAPNKRHRDALDAFEILWKDGFSGSLVIIGRLGWLTDDLCARLRSHPERGRRLHWLDDADDAELASAYQSAHALVAASECEGFGLPVVEALARGTPVIASDIPPFREVAGPWADYFPMGDAAALAATLRAVAAEPRRDVSAFVRRGWDEAARDALAFAATS